MEQMVGTLVFIILAIVVVWLLEATFSVSEVIVSFFILPYQFMSGKKKEKPCVDELDCTPSTGVVIKAILPPDYGQIKYSGSFWRAVADEPIHEETIVQVVERRDLIIHVRPLGAGEKVRW